MRIFLDMDGVLTDFVGALCKLVKYDDAWPLGEYDIVKVLGGDVWDKITEAGEDLWINMEKTAEADELMAIAERYDYYIATSPSLDPYSASGKMHWIQMNYPSALRRLIITPVKHLHARSDTLLIDDSDAQLVKWREAGGIALPMPRPWNSYWKDLDTMRIFRKIQEVLK